MALDIPFTPAYRKDDLFFIKNVLVRKNSARAMSTGSGGKKRRGIQIW